MSSQDRVRGILDAHVSDNGTGDVATATARLAVMIDRPISMGKKLAEYARFHAMHDGVSEEDRRAIDGLCRYFEQVGL